MIIRYLLDFCEPKKCITLTIEFCIGLTTISILQINTEKNNKRQTISNT